MNPRGLDHIMHAVRDLDDAAAFYGRLGFTIGGLNTHPWGTHNRQFRLPGFGGEIVTLAEPDLLGADGFSEHFGRFHQSFLARREGLSVMLVTSADIEADAAQLRRDGIASSEVLTQTWTMTAADGVAIQRGFALAYARDPLSPDASFALCAQVNPDPSQPAPALLRHANGAMAIGGAVLVADNPTDHHIFMSQFCGVRDMHASSAGLRFATPRGDIDILTPTAFNAFYGVEWNGIGAGAVIAAMRILVRDLRQAEDVMRTNGIAPLGQGNRLVIPPDMARGATLVFEEGTAS